MSANFIRADKIQFWVMAIADYEKVYVMQEYGF